MAKVDNGLGLNGYDPKKVINSVILESLNFNSSKQLIIPVSSLKRSLFYFDAYDSKMVMKDKNGVHLWDEFLYGNFLVYFSEEDSCKIVDISGLLKK